MNQGRMIAPVIKVTSLKEADEADLEYYASISWKESVAAVERMRRLVWAKEYKLGMLDKRITKANINDDRDGIE